MCYSKEDTPFMGKITANQSADAEGAAATAARLISTLRPASELFSGERKRHSAQGYGINELYSRQGKHPIRL